jgi:hypothetical protein
MQVRAHSYVQIRATSDTDELHDLGTNTGKWLVCKYLVVSPQAKMPSEICTSRREDNIKVNRTEVGCVWNGIIWRRIVINEGLL